MSSLARRPEATTYSIQDLVLAVGRGHLRIPRFQRSFQWEREDVIALFDSVYRGFPVGNLLMWKHPAHAERVEIGPIHVDAPQLSQALWVVDGQQRITALAGALLRPGDTGDDRFDLYFDLAEETFLVPRKRIRRRHWLPVHVALDTQILLEWLMTYASREKQPEHQSAAMRLGKALIEYRIPAYVVEAEDERTLRVIFERMNTAGKGLKPADVFNALFAEPGDPPSRVDELSRDLSAVGFGTIDDATLVKSVLAVEGLDVTQSIESFRETPALAGATRRAGPALRRAISFLRDYAAIPHVDLMPATFPLLPLARFFALHWEPSPRSRELLSRWLWRALVDHLRHGHHPSRTRRAVDAIDPDEEESVQRLLAGTSREPWAPDELPAYNWQSGVTKLTLVALAALAPRDLVAGLPVDLPVNLTTFGPRMVQRIDATSHADLHGNRILHPPSPGLQAGWASSLVEATDTIRRSHLVRSDETGQPEDVQARERALTAYVGRFVAARTAVAHSDRASIKHLLDRAADDDAA